MKSVGGQEKQKRQRRKGKLVWVPKKQVQQEEKVQQVQQETTPIRAITPNIMLGYPRNPQISAITETWIQLSLAEQFETLKLMLELWSEQGVSTRKLFEQGGKYLLEWAVCCEWSSAHLHFMYDHVPIDLLQDILAVENFGILKGIFTLETSFDQILDPTAEHLEERKKKFILLLKIDSDSVRRYFTINEADERMFGLRVQASLIHAWRTIKNSTKSASTTTATAAVVTANLDSKTQNQLLVNIYNG